MMVLFQQTIINKTLFVLILEDGKLPPLPTRAEIELRSGINRQQDTDQSRLSESIPGTSSALEDVDPDEDIVDIHFDCE